MLTEAGERWLGNGVAMREYDEEHYALQAAIAGQGLVLASSVLVAETLSAGLLGCYRPQVNVEGSGYSALCVPGRQRHPPVNAFFTWLGQEINA